MNVILIIVIVCVSIFILTKILNAINRHNHEQSNRLAELSEQFKDKKESFDSSLSGFFSPAITSCQDTCANLTGLASDMRDINSSLKMVSRKYDLSATVNTYSELADAFGAFCQKVKNLPYTNMMDPADYGKIRKPYWDSVRSMNRASADLLVAEYENYLSAYNYPRIFTIDMETLLRCVWFYATDKPYSAESFSRAANLFNCITENSHADVTIAELYALNQLGGEDVLRERIRNILKSDHTSGELTLIASCLMWINAYQTETTVLQHMLSSGMQMPTKTQERLHSLTNGGGKAPVGFEVASDCGAMYFDVSALAWKDDEYTGLFENLAFREKTLSYSLAVRDENKDIFVTSGFSIPDTSKILGKLKSVFSDEYGSAVTAVEKECIALSGSGEEHLNGILVVSGECRQMGVLVHIARIGKKLNIKFYTLFMPGGTGLAEQKQQALSLYKKLSPSVAMWESSLKDTVLMAIQQLLNEEPQYTVFEDSSSGYVSPGDDSVTVF